MGDLSQLLIAFMLKNKVESVGSHNRELPNTMLILCWLSVTIGACESRQMTGDDAPDDWR